MQPTSKRVLHWTPRVLGILFALFVSLFALDVFNESRGFWETALAFLIHLAPVGILLVLLGIAWRWEMAGGILFIGIGFAYLVMTWGRFPWPVYAVMSGIPWLLGTLFLLDWRLSTGLKSRT